MSYTHIEYYENGNLKSIQVSGVFVSFEAGLKDLVINSPAVLLKKKGGVNLYALVSFQYNRDGSCC